MDKRIEMLNAFQFDSVEYDPAGNIIVTHGIGKHQATWTIAADRSMSGMIADMQGFLRGLDELFTGGKTND